MSEQAIRARRKFRNEISQNYSATRHIILNLMIMLLPIVPLIAILAVVGWSLLTLLIGIPLGILIGNCVEYSTHRWMMHVRRKRSLELFRRHAGVHHRSFTSDFMMIEDPRDITMVMLPSSKMLQLLLMIAAGVFLLSLFNVAIACVVGIVLCFYALVEEFLHSFFHLEWTWSSRSKFATILRKIGIHHRRHHEHKLMSTYNFNITFPLGDLMLGTLYHDT